MLLENSNIDSCIFLLADSGGGEYPYLKEMKERLLLSRDPPLAGMDNGSPHDHDNQVMEVHQTPVGTVVKVFKIYIKVPFWRGKLVNKFVFSCMTSLLFYVDFFHLIFTVRIINLIFSYFS